MGCASQAATVEDGQSDTDGPGLRAV